MNPTLLKDLILAGHRVACKTKEWQWKVFLFINWKWELEWTSIQKSIDISIASWLSSVWRTEKEIIDNLIWEYKIVTPLPQLPQVWDTVEVLEICRELPLFNEWRNDMKDMVWKKYMVEESDYNWMIMIWDDWIHCMFNSRQVAKCEPEKEQSIQPEEQFWDTIVVNWRTYKAI